MSDTKTLNKTVKRIKYLEQGLPADWDEIKDNFDWYMKANYPNKALFSLSEKEQLKIFEDLRNINKGEDTI